VPILALGLAATLAGAPPVSATGLPHATPAELLIPVQGGPTKLPSPPPGNGQRPPSQQRPAFALNAADAARTPPLQADQPVRVTLQRGQTAFFRVAPEAGEAWTVVTRRLGRGTDTVLATLNERGQVVAEDDDGGDEDLASRLEHQPGDGGRLIRASVLDDAGGRFELVLTRDPVLPPPDFATTQAQAASRPPLTLGQPVHVRLRRNQAAFFALPADRRDVVARTRNLSRNADTALALLDQDGRVVAENDDSGDGLASLLSIAEDAPGLTLRAALVDGAAGEFDLVLEREAPSPPPDYPTSLEQARARGPLAPGQTMRIEMGRNSRAIFALPEGQPVTVITRNLRDDADTSLALLDAEGKVILEDDDGGDGLASRVTTNDAEGRAAFVRATLLNGQRGGFDLAVQAAIPVPRGAELAGTPEEAASRPGLVLGEVMRVHLAPGAEGFVALPDDGQASLAMTFDLGREVDTVLALVDAGGTVLDENDDAEGLASRLNVPAQPRPVFLRVKLVDDSAGDFSLVLVRPAR
jgi:hypothetical protein